MRERQPLARGHVPRQQHTKPSPHVLRGAKKKKENLWLDRHGHLLSFKSIAASKANAPISKKKLQAKQMPPMLSCPPPMI
jgi:hypothetical protein